MIRRLRTRIIVVVVALLAVMQVVAYGVVGSAHFSDAQEQIETQRMLLALSAISLLLCVGGALAIARSITGPITQLTKAAARIQAGDYSQPVQLARSDESGALASSLDHMRNTIAEREQKVVQLAYRDTLDRSFIKDMSDATTATIVRSTIDLGHSLGLKVVAEGVEDEAICARCICSVAIRRKDIS